MKLQEMEKWVREYFTDDSTPCLQRVRRLLREGKLPGQKVGGAWYVDVEAFSAPDSDIDAAADALIAQAFA